MSSIGSSTSVLSENLIGDEIIPQPSNIQSLHEISLNKRHPNSLDLGQAMIEGTQDNTVSQNKNHDFSISPTDNLRKVVCTIDVKRFKLNELMVGIESGYIVIRGNHKEKKDKLGLISRTFTRRMAIPRNIIRDEIRPFLHSDGKLSIIAKKRFGTFKIPIHRVLQPALARHRDQPYFMQNPNRPKCAMFNTGFLALLASLQTSPHHF